MTLEEESKRATDLLSGKVVAKMVRHRLKEVLVEFTDGTTFFVDHMDDGLDLSVTAGSDSSLPED